MSVPTSKVRAVVGFLGAAANSFDVLSGAVDIIVLRCSDGTFRSSPFICRFGRFKCIRSYEKIVRIEINGELNPDVYMKIGSAGEAYFIAEARGPVPAELVASPLGSPGWTSPRSPDSAGSSPPASSPISSPDLAPRSSPPLPPSISLSSGLDHPQAAGSEKEPRGSPLLKSSPRADADASSSSSSVSPPPHHSNSAPMKGACREAIPQADNRPQNMGRNSPRHKDQENLDVDLLFQKLSGFASHQAASQLQSNSDGCSPENSSIHSKAATMASSGHSSLPATPACQSRSRSPSPPPTRDISFATGKALPPPVAHSKSAPLPDYSKEEEDDDGQLDDLLVDDGYRGLNDCDLLANDSDGASEYPTEMMKLTKTTFPSSAQLAQLNLKDGVNTIRFLVKTTLRGLQQISAKVYLWPENTKLVISDVDGTVTRSDVLGQILPPLGWDWSHTGICQMYTSIANNGYKMLYLSSRSVSQAAQTRNLLTNVKQGGLKLPDGPLFVSPDRIFGALAREVILRKPEEFKIAALKTVRDVFPNGSPFYAGFGNRDTDFISYREVGIPAHKIFTINSSGLLSIYYCKYESYARLHELVSHVFPPIAGADTIINSDFDAFSYWSLPWYENISSGLHGTKADSATSSSKGARAAYDDEVLRYEWQWVNSDESKWSAYGRDVQRKIEAAFQSGKSDVHIQTPKGWYTVVFKSGGPEAEGFMHIQKSDKSKKQRSVRRVVNPDAFVGWQQAAPTGWNFWRRTSSGQAMSKAKGKAAQLAIEQSKEAQAIAVDKAEQPLEVIAPSPPPPCQFKIQFSPTLLDVFSPEELKEELADRIRTHFVIDEDLDILVFTQHAWLELSAQEATKISDGAFFKLRNQKVTLARRKGSSTLPKRNSLTPLQPGIGSGSPLKTLQGQSPTAVAADNIVQLAFTSADEALRSSRNGDTPNSPPSVTQPLATSPTDPLAAMSLSLSSPVLSPSSPTPNSPLSVSLSSTSALSTSSSGPQLGSTTYPAPRSNSGWFGWLKGNVRSEKPSQPDSPLVPPPQSPSSATIEVSVDLGTITRQDPKDCEALPSPELLSQSTGVNPALQPEISV